MVHLHETLAVTLEMIPDWNSSKYMCMHMCAHVMSDDDEKHNFVENKIQQLTCDSDAE